MKRESDWFEIKREEKKKIERKNFLEEFKGFFLDDIERESVKEDKDILSFIKEKYKYSDVPLINNFLFLIKEFREEREIEDEVEERLSIMEKDLRMYMIQNADYQMKNLHFRKLSNLINKFGGLEILSFR